MSQQVCVARIGAAHGVRGEVKLWTFTEDPLAATRYGALSTKDGARQFEGIHAREAKGFLVATLKGITTRNEAERLNGIELYIARDKLPETEAEALLREFGDGAENVLFAEADNDVSDFARALGVAVFTYTPMWIADYLQLVQFRARSSLVEEPVPPSPDVDGS